MSLLTYDSSYVTLDLTLSSLYLLRDHTGPYLARIHHSQSFWWTYRQTELRTIAIPRGVFAPKKPKQLLKLKKVELLARRSAWKRNKIARSFGGEGNRIARSLGQEGNRIDRRCQGKGMESSYPLS